MIYRTLGRLVRRAWPLLLAGWALLVLGTWYAAPPWEQVAQDKEFDFLPADSPSLQADKLFAEAFPDDRLASTIVLVLEDRTPGHLERNKQFIQEVIEPELRKIADAEGGLAAEAAADEPLFGDEPAAPAAPKKRSLMARIRTPNAPGSGALLVSPDHQALLVVIELTTEFLTDQNWPTIYKIERLVRSLNSEGKLPPGVDIAITGSAVMGRDHVQAEEQSAHSTETLTVILVVVLLILIYRAPLLAIIPLSTVYLAVLLARNLLALLAEAGWVQVFPGLEIYITILAYGAGVDYCLFLTARYKEELDRGAAPAEAMETTVGAVGGALVASAGTVMCGIAMMYFAQFGKFSQAGVAIPLSLLLVLLATLTFSTSLLRLAGRWAFWPDGKRRPAPAVAELPADQPPQEALATGRLQRAWDRVAQVLLRRPGTVWLITFSAMAPFVVVAGLMYNRISYDVFGTLPSTAPSVAGTRILQEHFPDGVMGPITVLMINHEVDFASPRGRALVKELTDRLVAARQDLGLADVRSLSAPLGVTPAATDAFAGSNLSGEAQKEGLKREALTHYVTSLGERSYVGTRLDLVLEDSPFSPQSVQDFDRIKGAVRDALPGPLKDSQLYFAGATASVYDLARVTAGDRTRIEGLVLACVFVILVLLLRALVVPIYLLLSVLFSYYATLGVSFLVFWALDPQGFVGIDWKVAIFLFTILIAVGEDYNIFLLTRVREEQKRHGPLIGITWALDRTGPIISSCGIIMAGTFGSLLGASLTEMKQLGFALAFGVLLDTFVVRPVLVPAFLIMMNKGWLPLHRRPLQDRRTPAQVHRPEQASS